ncbi:hypothetical protein [Streptomyces sp. NBC_00019]|uniref:hypothetical protein n=1 Tax=Streptomyces sp. NBC_00019 TaxID=2975623 RepID=UPI00324CFB30
MSTNPSQPPVISGVAALLAVIPPLLSLSVGFVLHTQDAERVAQVAAGVIAVVTAGLPVLQRSTSADCRRAAGPPGPVTHLLGPRPRVVPSPTTVVLTIVLGVGVFWLLDLLTTWVGLGSLGYWSGEYPSDPSAVYRTVVLRALVVLVPAIFVVAVAMAHRLHDLAGRALLITSVLFTIAVLATNAVLLRHWDSEPMAEDVYVPLVLGAIAWVVCLAGRRYAVRTQELFDLMQAVGVEWRRAEADRRP